MHPLSLCCCAWLVFFGFSSTHPNSTPFPVLARTLLRYSPGFFSCTYPDSTPFSVLACTLLQYSLGFFSCTYPDSTLFSILAWTLLQYSPEFYPFLGTRLDPSPVLTRILPLFRYSPEPFFGTHSDTVLSVLDSPVLTWIQSPICLVFFDTRSDTISYPVSFLDFLIFSSIASGFL